MTEQQYKKNLTNNEHSSIEHLNSNRVVNITNITTNINIGKNQKNPKTPKKPKNQKTEFINNLQKEINSQENTVVKILTLNVRGITKEYKQLQLEEYIKEEKFDIIGLSETKLHQQMDKHQLTGLMEYKILWSSKTRSKEQANYGSGVNLILHKELYKHHAGTKTIPGRAIAADLKFKGKKTIRIINCYIPADKSTQKNERINIQNEIKKWIQEVANKRNTTIIIMSDFNQNIEKFYEIERKKKE